MKAKSIIYSITISLFTTFSMLCWIMATRPKDPSTFWEYSVLIFTVLGGCIVGWVCSKLIIEFIKYLKTINIE
jgi:hypothetical protein